MTKTCDISIEEKAEIYAFLKIVFAIEPSTTLLKHLRTPEIFESLKSTGVILEAKDFDQSQLQQLLKDYTQLFIGPGKHISLNESIYTENVPQFWGESTVEIKKLIEHVGLQLDDHWKQMPDHISVEFELMQALLETKIEALRNNDQQTVEQCGKAINILFDEHIVKWIPKVCNQVIEKAQTPVYKAIGMWTKAFIQSSPD